ncbi:MAG: ECF-type sigma factor [Isosphaeraceae bacterium]
MATDPLVVFSGWIVAETPQGVTVILGWARAGDEQARGEPIAVHEALDRLAEQDGRQAQVMTLRDFGGVTVAEVAAALGGSVAAVENDWRVSRAWLAGQLGGWDG